MFKFSTSLQNHLELSVIKVHFSKEDHQIKKYNVTH